MTAADREAVLAVLRTRWDAVFARAAEIARSPRLEEIFDDLGFRRSLGGFKTLLRAVRLYCDVKPADLSRRSFRKITERLARERGSDARWMEKQMRLVIDRAYKTGTIARFAKYAVANPVIDPLYPMTAVEFAAEMHSRLILDALRENSAVPGVSSAPTGILP